MKRKISSIFLILAGVSCVAMAAGNKPVSYPDGYRQWQHVKSMIIQQGHPLHGAFGGIHHLYANRAAVAGYAKGTFPDGAVIVFDLLEANEADHAIVEGARKVVGVMHRDAKRWAATGGWGFEGFAGDSATNRVVGGNAATACFECHRPRAADQFVFSRTRP